MFCVVFWIRSIIVILYMYVDSNHNHGNDFNHLTKCHSLRK